MRRKTVLLAFLLASCSDGSGPTTPVDTGTGGLAAAPVRCPTGYYRQGNRCIRNPVPVPVPVPTPTPTPTPTPVPVPAQTCWDGSVIPTTQSCPVQPPPPPPPVQCSDGTTLPAGSTCPPPIIVGPPIPPAPTPTPTNTWVSAPLQDGGFARVKAAPSSWSHVGPGAGRALVPGELVAIYFNGWGISAEGQPTWSIYAFSDKSMGAALASDLQGTAAVGTPPDLPAGWWVPGLVTAAKTCGDVRGGPGVVAGGLYRAAMVVGSWTQLTDGQTGTAGVQWNVFATGDGNAPDLRTAHVVVTGDCLTGGRGTVPTTAAAIRRVGERG